MLNFFWGPKLPRTPVGSPDIYFGSVRQKNSTEYIDIPLLWIKLFDRSEIGHKSYGSPAKILSTVRQKEFDRKLWCARTHAKSFSKPKTFWISKGFDWETFCYCETKKFWQKNLFYPSSAHNFLIPEISETHITSPTKFFGIVRQKTWQNFVIYSSCAKDCSKPKTFWNSEWFVWESFGYCDTKSFRQKIMISHLAFIKSLDAQKLLEYHWIRLIFVSVVWDKKNRHKIVIYHSHR